MKIRKLSTDTQMMEFNYKGRSETDVLEMAIACIDAIVAETKKPYFKNIEDCHVFEASLRTKSALRALIDHIGGKNENAD